MGAGSCELCFLLAVPLFQILGNQDDWFKAELHGHEGFVPRNYIERRTPGWFHEGLTRQAAEEILKVRDVGAFVIRGSQSSPGDFSISVRGLQLASVAEFVLLRLLVVNQIPDCQNVLEGSAFLENMVLFLTVHETDVQHFKVMKDGKGSYFLWTEKFPSLNQLVEFYKMTSISKQKQIFLVDGTREEGKRGSLEERFESAPPTQRRQSEIPVTHQMKRGSLEERAQTGGGFGNSSGLPPPPRRQSDPPQCSGGLRVRGLYDFIAEESDELGFRAGDVIEVLDQSDSAWWRGRLRGQTGLFPSNYITPL
ncbi:GRAP2 protein, partial [Polyodon spathula]|nr:GRAP2 protein [Polyodon spathula]